MKNIRLDEMPESVKKEIVVTLDKQHDEARSNQREARRKWAKTEHYVAGRQYWATGGGGQLGRPVGHEVAGAPSATGNLDDEYTIYNEIRRIYQTNQQRLTSYYMDTQIVPDTKDSDQKQGARLGRIYLNDIIRRTPKLKPTLARHLQLYNKTFLKVSWDPSKGRLIRKPTSGTFDKMKQWFLGPDLKHEGELIWSAVNPNNVLLPKFCHSAEHADEVEECHVESTNLIYRSFGAVVKPESVHADDLGMYGSGAGWIGDAESEGRLGGISDSKENRVLLKEKVIRPCVAYQKGAIFTWASGTLLRATTLLEHYPDLNYFDAEIDLDDRDIFGTSILWDLIPIQDTINLSLSAQKRWLKAVAMLRLWVPEGCNLTEDDLTNATNMAVKFGGDKPPTWDQIPELSETFFKILENSRDFMQSHGFANELAKQRRAMSGNALGILQEMDDTIFRPALESLSQMFSKAGTFTCQIAPKYITTPRTIKMSSMQGWQIENSFKGDMLRGDFHAEVNLMAGLPSNKVMRLEYLKSLYKDGLMEKDQVQAYLEFPNDQMAVEELQKQHEIADDLVKQLENFDNYTQQTLPSAQEGAPPTKGYVCNIMYHQFDNHGLLAAKIQVAMQENFDHWNPWIQMAFLEHWKYHTEQLQLALQAQMQVKQGPPAPGGTPGPAPAPGGAPSPLSPAAESGGIQPNRDQVPQPMNAGTGMPGAD